MSGDIPWELWSWLAVVPVRRVPLEGLAAASPLLLLALVLVLGSVGNAASWRAGAVRLWWVTRGRRSVAAVSLLLVLVAGGGTWWLLGPVSVAGTSSPTSQTGSWPTMHGGPTRCGWADPNVGTAPITGRISWKFREPLLLDRRPFAASAALTDDAVIIGSDNYNLYCLDLGTGNVRWRFAARHPVFSSAAVGDGRVFVGEGLHEDNEAKFYCLEATSGRELWSIQTTSHTESSPTLAGESVVFGAGDDGVYCADTVTGQVRWRYGDAHVDGGPLVVGERVYFGSGYGFQGVVCLKMQDGGLVWRQETRAAVWGAPSFQDGRLYVAVGNGTFVASDPEPHGEVLCLDPRDGRELWRFTEAGDGVLTAVALEGGLAVFGSRDGRMYALDAQTGRLRWSTNLGVPVLSSPAVASGQVLVGADDGRFRCLDLQDGRELWSVDTSEDTLTFYDDSRIQCSPVMGAGRVLFGSSNGNVYCLGQERHVKSEVARAGFRSRLMCGAEWVIMRVVDGLKRHTGSLGWAIILTALAVRGGLTPVDWRQTREAAKLRGFEPELRRIEQECRDKRDCRAQTHRLYAEEGPLPLGILGAVFLQVPILVTAILVVHSTPVFAGESFLWMKDLSVADRLGLAAGWGWNLNLLPVVLAAAVGACGMVESRAKGRGWWLALAAGLGLLTYRWSAAVQIFLVVLLMSGTAVRWVMRRVLASSGSRAFPAG